MSAILCIAASHTRSQGKTRVALNIKAIANFSNQLFATNVSIKIPVSEKTTRVLQVPPAVSHCNAPAHLPAPPTTLRLHRYRQTRRGAVSRSESALPSTCRSTTPSSGEYDASQAALR